MRTKQAALRSLQHNDTNGANKISKSTKQNQHQKHHDSKKWSKNKINKALELLQSNNYTLKYTSIKTGIPKNILKENADLKQIKYKDTEETDEENGISSDSDISNGNDSDESIDDSYSEISETNEEQVLIDPPRTLTARKSTSPLKFFMKSFKITSNQRNYSSNISTTSSETSTSITPYSQKQARIQQKSQQQTTKLVPSTSESNLDSKQQQLIPHTNKIIDYIIIGSNQDFNHIDVHTHLQNKSKLIEEIEKTVKIYAYLGLRQRFHPIFLNRTLSYMSNHNNKKRKISKIKQIKNGQNQLDTQRKRLESKIQELHTKLKPKLNDLNNNNNLNKTYEFKFSFNYFQINNQKFLKELFNESEDTTMTPPPPTTTTAAIKNNSKSLNIKKCNIELYGITSNKSSLIGKCKTDLIIDTKTLQTFDQTNQSRINFKLKQLYSYYLIRVYFKKSIQQQQQNLKQTVDNREITENSFETVQNSKKRKRNGLVHKSSSVSKKSRTNIFLRKETNSLFTESNQHDFYLICTLNLNTSKENKMVNLSSIPIELKDYFKRTIHLNLDKCDEYLIEMKQILYKKERKQLLLNLDLNLDKNNESEEDNNSDNDETSADQILNRSFNNDSSNKKSKTTRTRLIKHDSKSDISQNYLDDLLNKTNNYLLKFSIETKVVSEALNTTPNNHRTSTRTNNKMNNSNSNGNHIQNTNSDDDIIIISPPDSPISKKYSSLALVNGAQKLIDNKLEVKRLTRSTKSVSTFNLCDKSKVNNINIFYQFIKNETIKLELPVTNGKMNKTSKVASNTSTRLMTQKFDYVCPFCQLDCKQLNFLCFHFQMIHFRFHIEEQNINGTTTNLSQAICNNNYMECSSKDYTDIGANKKIQFNIRLDENFNGSYLGNPYDHHYAAHLGFSLSRLKPSKRNQVSFVLVNKKSNIFDLSQFKDLTQEEFSVLNIIQQQQQQLNCQMQPNNLYNCQAGIERLYYHTQTGQPIHVEEVDNDSDNDLDPDWLKEQTNLLIDDFDDVNEGEKDMMRLWNLHNIKFNYIPDCQFYKLCELFIQEQTENMMRRNLCSNFILLLANLFDYGLLNANEMMKLNDYLNEKKTELMSKMNITNIKSPTKRNSFINKTPDKLINNHKTNYNHSNNNKSFTK